MSQGPTRSQTRMEMNKAPIIAFDWIDTLNMRRALRQHLAGTHPQTKEFLDILKRAGFRVVIISGGTSHNALCDEIGVANEDFISADFKDKSIRQLREFGHELIYYVSDMSLDAAEALNGGLDGVVVFENLHASSKTADEIESQRRINAELLRDDLIKFGHGEVAEIVKHVVGFDELYRELRSMTSGLLPDLDFEDKCRPQILGRPNTGLDLR